MPRTLSSCPLNALLPAKRERRKEARPGELLAAALELFVEKGFAATRVDEVAQRAGVSKGTLFLYFATKEELFKAVVRENLSGRFGEWTGELESFEGTSAELLRYCMRSWWERIGSTPASGIPKLVMSEAKNFPELASFFKTEVIDPADALLRRVIKRGVDSGEFRSIDLKYGAYSLLAPMMFISMWKHSLALCGANRTDLVPEEFIAAQIDTILHGILQTASAGTPPSSLPVAP
jgi:TetR/AcrR family transcriptional regulator